MTVSPDASALGTGLLLGDDSNFSPSFKSLVKLTGVTHLVAASGTNLGFVEALTGIWTKAFPRLIQLLFLFLAHVYYLYLVGESGSLWRAIVMWTIRVGLSLFGWQPSDFITWILVLIATYFLQYQYLFSASFILSFLAIIFLGFSQKFTSGENNYCFLPQNHRLWNYCKNAYLQGVFIVVGVSFWLIPAYGVFQPIGIISTFVLEPVLRPYTWIAFARTLSVQGVSWMKDTSLVPILTNKIGFTQQTFLSSIFKPVFSFCAVVTQGGETLLFTYVLFALNGVATLVQNPLHSVGVTGGLVCLSLLLVGTRFISHFQRKYEREQWIKV